MAWTDAATVQDWVKGVDLGLTPAAVNQSMTDAEILLRGKLAIFISPATLLTWTTMANTPARICQWDARMSAAHYMSRVANYQLVMAEPDNQAARMYADVMAEIQDVQDGKAEILGLTGSPVARISTVLTPLTVAPEATSETWPFTTTSDDVLE